MILPVPANFAAAVMAKGVTPVRLSVMRKVNFHIVFQVDAWRYISDEVTSGPYQTQAQALHAAEAFVRARGIDAHVRIYRFDGIRQAERTYSRTMVDSSERHSKASSPAAGDLYGARAMRKVGE
jgi:hypothetical protein